MNILDLLFPRFCIGCKKDGEYLCGDCKKSLISHPEICPYCHRFSKNFETCIDCRCEKGNFLNGLIIGFSYKNLLKKLVLALKFYHKRDIGDFLASRLELAVLSNQYFHNKMDRIIFSRVPSHRYRRYFVKGYNQSEILAKLTSQKLGAKYVNVMKKIRHTSSQTGLNREKRLKNLTNVFELKDFSDLNDGSILIFVDDITTTGSTINELAKVVKSQIPNIEIWGLVVGRHVG